MLIMVLVCVVGLHSLTAEASPNEQINYQGKLTDTTGKAVTDGTYNMRFYLYDTEGAATTSAIWTETLTGIDRVQVTDGLFSVMLGSTTALTSINFNQTLYLGVEIGDSSASPSWDGEMSPRKVLGTVPAAFEAIRFDGLATSSFLRSDQADTASGLLKFTGGLISSASSTLSLLTFGTATGTTLALSGDTITDFTGTGLSVTSGVLNVGKLATSSLDIAGPYTDGHILQASTTAAGGYAWAAVSSLGFVDGIGGSNRVAFWSDSDTLTSDSGFTFSSSILTVPALTASNASATSTIAGGLNLGSGDFLYDFSNNNVFIANRLGIGERSPQSPLDITVDTDATGGTRLFNFSNNFTGQDVTWNFELDEDKDLTLESTSGVSDLSFSPSTNATDLLYLTASGQVGIGTTSPSERLTVHDGISLVTEGDPVKVGGVELTDRVQDIVVSGNYAYMAVGFSSGRLEIFDISSTTNPTKVGSAATADWAEGVAVSGNYAYVVTNSTGDDLEIFDISDPTNPTKVGGAAAADDARGVAVSGNYAYVVTDTNTGDELEIFNISDPTNPTKVGGAGAAHTASDVAVSGNYAYVTTWSSINDGLEIFDISDPTNPTKVGGADTAASATGIAVSGSYAYIVTSVTGDDLEIFDISSSTNPVKVGGVQATYATNGVVVSGNYAYVGSESPGDDDLEVFNISDPTNPTKVGGAAAADSVIDVAVSGNYAYVVTNLTGDDLEIFELSGVRAPTGEIGTLLVDSIDVKQLLQTDSAVIHTGLNVGQNAMIGGALTITGTASSTSQLANTNPALIVASGNVGIGTTSPSALFHIDQNGDSTANGLRTYNTGGSQWTAIYTGSDNTSYFQNQDGFLALSSSGNVGIGTTSPSSKLEVYGAGGGVPLFTVDDTSAGKAAIRLRTAGVQQGLLTLSGLAEGDTSNDLSLFSETGLRFYTGGTASERMVIDTSGNVGIGTTSAGARLQVSDDTPATSIDNAAQLLTLLNADTTTGAGNLAGIRFRQENTTNSANSFIGLVDNGGTSRGSLVFAPPNASGNATERMRIDESGDVGIGVASPGVRLWVQGNTNMNTAVINNIGTAPNYIFDVRDDGTTFFRVGPTGDVCGPDADLSNCASDEQLKTDVEKLTFTLEDVMRLRAVTFKWNERAHEEFNYDTERENIGFIAQEVAAVIPEWVTEVSADSEYLKVDEGMLKYALLSAVQELNLNLETIASTTGSSTATSTAFAVAFFDNLILKITQWLADAANGIGHFFAERIQTNELRTDELCVGTMCVDEATFVEIVEQVRDAQSDDAEGGDEPRDGGSTDDGDSDPPDGESTDPPPMPPEPETSSSTATSSAETNDGAGGTGSTPDDAGDTQPADRTAASSLEATDASSTADPGSGAVDPSPADDQDDGEPGQNPPLDNSKEDAAQEPAAEPEPEIAA